MLVLERLVNQKIHIGDDMVLQVVRVLDGRVRLRVQVAPASVRVYEGTLYQKARLSDDVLVQIVRIRGNRVRLGIEAPRSTTILREELIARHGMQPYMTPPSVRTLRQTRIASPTNRNHN